MPHALSSLFSPSSIAVFGASERVNTLGSVVYRNILAHGFPGPVYAINPKHTQVFDTPCYRSIDEVKEPVQLAVIATPAVTVANIFEECGKHGVKAAVVMSAGFGESGQRGEELERKITEIARYYGIRFIGPNCLGFVCPPQKLNACFANGAVKSGKLALISQSAALCTAILDWANPRDIGFSAVVSMGISIDINFGEILDYLVADPKTQSIMLYIEGVRDARAFMSGLRAAARVKPVVVVKAGRHQASVEATKSHTGACSGSDDVFEAALRRAGVVRGMHIGDLFAAATVLSRRIKLRGDNLALITNGGGPAAMACDKASDLHIPLADFQPETYEKLNTLLPPIWSHINPVDILGEADDVRYKDAVSTVLDDKNVHGAIVLLTPQASTDATAIARSMIAIAEKHTKPILTCWMGDRQVREGRKLMSDAGIPSFRLPETAVEGFGYLSSFYRNQKLLLETPGPLAHSDKPDIESARLIIHNALSNQRQHLTQSEGKAVLAAFHIPITASMEAKNAIEAVVAAASIGFPVSMKLQGHNLPPAEIHDSMRLNISSSAATQAIFTELAEMVTKQYNKHAFEGVVIEPMVATQHALLLSISIRQDVVFGPVITLGAAGGGTTQVAFALPPLNRVLAQDLIIRSPFASLSNSVGNTAVENTLLRISEMACELPEIRQLEINPLVSDRNRVTAIETSIEIAEYRGSGYAYEHTAIHPYPAHLAKNIQLRDNTSCLLRPIRPEDAEIEREFVEGLSDDAKRYRFMNIFRELPREMLARFTQIDYDREMALIAVIQQEVKELQIGVARYTITPEAGECEFAIAIADAWQGKGVALPLMEELIAYARYRGLETMIGEVLSDNRKMLHFIKKLGFATKVYPDDPSLTYVTKHL